MTSLIKTVFQRFNSIGSSQPTLRNIFRQTGINLVCDVGAGCGDYAGELRQSGFEGWIVSFEESPDKFRILQADRMYDPRWTGFNIALTAGSHRLPKRPESSSSGPNPTAGTLAEMMDTLGQYVPIPSVCLKLGNDEQNIRVLEGAGSTLENVRVLQLGPKRCGETIRFLSNHGFEATCHLPPSTGDSLDQPYASLTVQARPTVPKIAIPPQVEMLNSVSPVIMARSA